MTPKGLSDGDLNRLVATLAVWILAVLIVEFAPTDAEEGAPSPSQPTADQA